jgi:hypothetical protein
MQYYGFSHWNMVVLALWMFVSGRYVSVGGFIKTWAPSAIILTIVLVIKYLL